MSLFSKPTTTAVVAEPEIEEPRDGLPAGYDDPDSPFHVPEELRDDYAAAVAAVPSSPQRSLDVEARIRELVWDEALAETKPDTVTEWEAARERAREAARAELEALEAEGPPEDPWAAMQWRNARSSAHQRVTGFTPITDGRTLEMRERWKRDARVRFDAVMRDAVRERYAEAEHLLRLERAAQAHESRTNAGYVSLNTCLLCPPSPLGQDAHSYRLPDGRVVSATLCDRHAHAVEAAVAEAWTAALTADDREAARRLIERH